MSAHAEFHEQVETYAEPVERHRVLLDAHPTRRDRLAPPRATA